MDLDHGLDDDADIWKRNEVVIVGERVTMFPVFAQFDPAAFVASPDDRYERDWGPWWDYLSDPCPFPRLRLWSRRRAT